MKRKMKKLAARLRSNRGESLVESLVSMVIAALMALMLAGAIISAARVNAGAKTIATLPHYKTDDPGTESAATLTGGFLKSKAEGGYTDSGMVTLDIQPYTDEGGFVYYEKG